MKTQSAEKRPFHSATAVLTAHSHWHSVAADAAAAAAASSSRSAPPPSWLDALPGARAAAVAAAQVASSTASAASRPGSLSCAASLLSIERISEISETRTGPATTRETSATYT